MVTYKTMPRKYFEGIIEAMKISGFDFMAWVTMNSRKNQYHVDLFDFVQSSYLFFSGPNALIVQLVFCEKFNVNQIISEKYWSIKIYYSWSYTKWIEDKNHWIESDFGSIIECLGEKICNLFTKDELFWVSGDSSSEEHSYYGFEQVYISNDSMDTETLVIPLKQLLKLIDPFLYKKFKSLQVTDFAPHYTFPGQETHFWDKFPMQRLYSKIGRVWGK